MFSLRAILVLFAIACSVRAIRTVKLSTRDQHEGIFDLSPCNKRKTKGDRLAKMTENECGKAHIGSFEA